jgi:hypothetical protein
MPEGTETPAPTEGDGTETGNQPDKTFTQAELDRIVQDRVAREQKKFGDYDDLKAKATKLDELEAANASEIEKAIKRAEDAEARAKAASERATESARRAAVVAQATKAGAVDPDAVLALLPKDSVTVGDDGQVTGVEDAIKALLESKPYLVGSTASAGATGSADGGARNAGNGAAQLSRDDLKTMTSAEIVKAKAEGRLAHLLGADS